MTAEILNHPLIAERYFYPRPESPARPFWVDAGDARLACFLHRPARSAGTVVFFHGNGEVVADYLDWLPGLLGRLGWGCLLAEFRGYGASSGQPQLGRLLDDVVPLLRAAGEPQERLVLYGRSVGSIFALEGAALCPGAAGLILESGVADVLERLLLRVSPRELAGQPGELEAAVRARLDHRAKLAGFAGPVLVLHGGRDDLVDPTHGERLATWAAGPVTLRIFPEAGHNDLLLRNGEEYVRLLQGFFASL